MRHAVRALSRSRGYGVVSLLVLAATVAINTVIFFMLDGVVLRPLPYTAPQRLVRLYDADTRTPKFPMSIGHYLDYRANARSLDGLALYTGRDMELSGTSGGSRHLTGVAVTSGFFAGPRPRADAGPPVRGVGPAARRQARDRRCPLVARATSGAMRASSARP